MVLRKGLRFILIKITFIMKVMCSGSFSHSLPADIVKELRFSENPKIKQAARLHVSQNVRIKNKVNYFLKAIGKSGYNPIVLKRLFKYNIKNKVIENFPDLEEKNKFEKIDLPKKLSHLLIPHKIKKEKNVLGYYNAKYILSIDKKLKNEITILFDQDVSELELEKLSHNQNIFIRSLVALHENCNVSTLDKLAEDKEFFIRYLVSSNIKTPIEILENIFRRKFKNFYVHLNHASWCKKQAIWLGRFDDETTKEYIEQIVFDTKNPFLAGELVAHPLTTEKTLIEAVKKFIFCNEGRTHDLLFQNRFLYSQNIYPNAYSIFDPMLKINPLGPITTVAVHPNANKEIHEMILSKFPHENYQEWNYLIRDGRGIKTSMKQQIIFVVALQDI